MTKRTRYEQLQDLIHTDTDECLPWEGQTDKRGHGCLNHDGKTWSVEKLILEQTQGPRPKGKVTVLCPENVLCCNPRHLSYGERPAPQQRDMQRYNENRLERVYGGMNAQEREWTKSQPCTFCGAKEAVSRWASGCPHHHDRLTTKCSQCWMFNSCDKCHSLIKQYTKLKHVPKARNPERVERILDAYQDEYDFPEFILDHYDL